MGLLDKFYDYKNTILGRQYISKALDSYGNDLQDTGFITNSGKADAMRHLLWTGEMSRKFNPTIAKGFSDWHEKVVTPWGILGGANPNQSESDMQMDLFNNALGIKIGQISNSYADTARLAREAIDSGKAYLINESSQNRSGGKSPGIGMFSSALNSPAINSFKGKTLSDIEVRLLQKKGLL